MSVLRAQRPALNRKPASNPKRRCSKCHQLKPIPKKYTTCYKCRARVWEKNKRKEGLDPREVRQAVSLNKYGKEGHQHYLQQFEEQQGCCAICGCSPVSPRNGKLVKLCQDHCHESDRRRGLLCRKCNIALGLLEDNPMLLQAALSYLEKWDLT